MQQLRVLVVGGVNMDLIVRVARLPRPGETVAGEDLLRAPGGKGANQAVAAARMGAAVAMVGRVGGDAFGRDLKRGLRAAGVSTRGVHVDAAHSTGAALIEVDDHGENTIAVASGANSFLRPADVPASLVRRADVVSAALEVPLDSIAEAFRLAHLAQVPTVLNAAPARRVPAELLRMTDVVVCNQHELGVLLGQSVSPGDEAQAARALPGAAAQDSDRAFDDASGRASRRPANEASRQVSERASGHPSGRPSDQLVVVTLGERGALAVMGDQRFEQRSFRVPSVDSVGAGDAFVAGFVCGRWWSAGVQAALRLGCAAGALATTRAGAQPAMPTLAEVQALLDG